MIQIYPWLKVFWNQFDLYFFIVSQSLLLQVGDKYALENEDELKDKMNFEEQAPYRISTGIRTLLNFQCFCYNGFPTRPNRHFQLILLPCVFNRYG